MLKRSVLCVWGLLALSSGALSAQVPNASGAAQTSDTRENGAPSDKAAVAGQRRGNPANRWRYRFYGGRWWYYHPKGQWSYWSGTAWTPYIPPAAIEPQPYGDLGGTVYYGGRRAPGTIQREKNEIRPQAGQYFEFREPGSIQREKNDTRWQSFEPSDIRPPGTIQDEKNNPRAY